MPDKSPAQTAADIAAAKKEAEALLKKWQKQDAEIAKKKPKK